MKKYLYLLILLLLPVQSLASSTCHFHWSTKITDHGRIAVRLTDSTALFRVRITNLSPLATYTVQVNGRNAGGIVTNERGAGKLQLTTLPRKPTWGPLLFDPRDSLVEIREQNAYGKVVLWAQVPQGEIKHNACPVRCCIAIPDMGFGCSKFLAGDCKHSSGYNYGVGQCTENLCAS